MRYEAYTDGSYKSVNGIELYASAAIIAPEGSEQWTQLIQTGSDPAYLPYHNVAGELFAAMRIFEYCLNTLHLGKDDVLRLNYDYKGICNWLKFPTDDDYWKARKEIPKTYRAYFDTYVRGNFKVVFNHTPGHSGILGNTIVDKLAKDALNRRLTELLEKKDNQGS